MPDEDSEAESPPKPQSIIQVTFAGGLHHTGLEISMANVDAAQLELAGHFLLRQAELIYTQAQANAQQGKLVIPPPGTRVS